MQDSIPRNIILYHIFILDYVTINFSQHMRIKIFSSDFIVMTCNALRPFPGMEYTKRLAAGSKSQLILGKVK